MRRPQLPVHMSTGAWIFVTGVAVALIASPGIYAAATSTVALGNTTGSATAYVTATRQLQTALSAPTSVVSVATGISPNSCGQVYTPPNGKAIVVTHVTYDLGSTQAGVESYAALEGGGCNVVHDYGDTVQAYEAQSHTFPTGLPMPSVAVFNGTQARPIFVAISGYLIPATQLPEENPDAPRWVKGIPRGDR